MKKHPISAFYQSYNFDYAPYFTQLQVIKETKKQTIAFKMETDLSNLVGVLDTFLDLPGGPIN